MEIVFYNQSFIQMLSVLSNYVSRDQRRPILTTAHIIAFDGKTFIEATDSAVLIRMDITSNIISSRDIEAFNFEPVGLLKMVKVIDKQVPLYQDSAKFYKVNDKYYCEYKGYSLPLKTVNDNYPNLDNVLPVRFPKKSFIDISLTTEKLRNILNSAEATKADVISFRSVSDDNKPLVLTLEGGIPMKAISLIIKARTSVNFDWDQAGKHFIKQEEVGKQYAN